LSAIEPRDLWNLVKEIS